MQQASNNACLPHQFLYHYTCVDKKGMEMIALYVLLSVFTAMVIFGSLVSGSVKTLG